ncbi:MAG TPA: hypothetical protein PLD62_08300, partial [Candidatus Cloacimonadota bacterium]|nr:hypothetical protein [Candidatus Cloacimonadota bacterium]
IHSRCSHKEHLHLTFSPLIAVFFLSRTDGAPVYRIFLFQAQTQLATLFRLAEVFLFCTL